MRSLVAALAALILMPAIHGSSPVLEDIPFLVFAAWTGVAALSTTSDSPWPRSLSALVTFQGLCVAHFFFVLSGKNSADEYIRGLIPFLFMWFAWIGARLVRTSNVHVFYYGLIAIAVAYAAQNYFAIPKLLSGEAARTTMENDNHSIPVPLLGFYFVSALASEPGRSQRWSLAWAGVGIFFLVSLVLTGTRSLMLSALIPLTGMYIFRYRRFLLGWRHLLIAAGVVAAFIAMPGDSFERQLRINDLHGMDTKDSGVVDRMQEVEVAFDYFLKSPILGQGLGFRFETLGMYQSAAKVGYIHNSPVYLLMDFGIWGALYFLPCAAAIYGTRRLLNTPYATFAIGMTWAIVALCMYTIGFAMVRLIQFNVFLFSMVGVLEGLKGAVGVASQQPSTDIPVAIVAPTVVPTDTGPPKVAALGAMKQHEQA